MPSAFRRARSQTYELLPRGSSDSDPERNGLSHAFKHQPHQPSYLSWMPDSALRLSAGLYKVGGHLIAPLGKRRLTSPVYWCFFGIPYAIFIAVIFTAIFRPSYSHPPTHYKEFSKRCTSSRDPGRGNVNNEKVFIAASIYDHQGELLGGTWGAALLELVDLLGPDNVFLSIYENDADPQAEQALNDFKTRVQCDSRIFTEHLSLDDINRVTIPGGDRRIKRIAFLAEVRNRALRPLETATIQYDKLLYVNDVMFNPIEAAQLLFSTGMDPATGRTTYGAACAVDFINPWKFYDRFATRDLEGYGMGIPFYPWFTSAGTGLSRADVLAQSDAVRVRACWGGMTAFEAKWFQTPVPAIDTTTHTPDSRYRNDIATINQPLRFRFEKDPYWDASECCLIHADLTFAKLGRGGSSGTEEEPLSTSGIVMNPYVRTAYDSTSLRWIPLTRRTERLYSWIHDMLNKLVGLPTPNKRRLEEPGDEVEETVWVYDAEGKSGEGAFQQVRRVVEPGRFCGGRKLLVINEHPKEGEKNWEDLPIPDRERL